jgi:hypothetical protein
MSLAAVSLEELLERPLEETLQELVANNASLEVRLPSGDEVVIGPKPQLRRLPKLEGRVPDGWKDAVYSGE